MSARAAALAGGLSLVFFAVFATPAAAEARGRIVGIDVAEGQIRVTFTAPGLGPGQPIDPASARVSLGGQPITAMARAGDLGDAVRVSRQVMLAIDTSGSMSGPGIQAARTAATAYVKQAPPDIDIGLVTFASEAQQVIPLTSDRARLSRAIAEVQASGETALYDGLRLAVAGLRATGDRQVLLLSDGDDTASRTPLPTLVRQLSSAKVTLNAVAFGRSGVEAALGTLTKAAGGRVVTTTDVGGLVAEFEQAARRTDNQIVITAPIPADLTADEAVLAVTATAAGQTLSDSALAVGLTRAAVISADPSGFGPQQVDLRPGLLESRGALYAALGAMFVGLLVIVGMATAALRRSGPAFDAQLSIYTIGGRQAAPRQDRAGLRDTAMGLADRVVSQRGLEGRLGQRLDAGGVPLKPAEWLILHFGIALCFPLFVLLISNVNVVLTLLAVVLGVFGPAGYLAVKKRRRTTAFLAQLPDTLQLLSGSLSAGYSLPQAVDAVVRQGNEPVAGEFNKALAEARLGVPVEDSLDEVALRMGSVDFGWVVMAIRIQREVGGNLAEVLSTVAATLRERERLRRQVQVLSAEGRLSGWILGGLPVVFALYLLATRPDYLSPLVQDRLGIVLLGLMAVLMTVGGLWMRKVVTVDV